MYYREALDYISGIERAGSDYGIERMRELLDALGSPDESLRIVHVAGTNGKGSVCAYLTSVLKHAGYRVGTYISPSVLDYNERFLLDGEPFSDDDVAKYMTIVRDAAEREDAVRAAARASRGISETAMTPLQRAEFTMRPTAFEIETALALAAFKDKGCGACVLETGLGGRWDATNAVRNKDLAVIASIGYDHCAILGGTLREIASEKAAIVKGRAVSCPQENEAREVLESAGALFSGIPRVLSRDMNGQSFEYRGVNYRIAMAGEYQPMNAALAIDALNVLADIGYHITKNDILEGLAAARWHARFEILTHDNIADSPYDIAVPSGKTLILDGAHNPQGAAALARSLKEYAGDRRMAAVVGVLANKDYVRVMREMISYPRIIYTVTPESPRALAAEKLAGCAREAAAETESGVEIKTAVNVREALRAAFASDCDTVVLFGSLTLFKEIARKRV